MAHLIENSFSSFAMTEAEEIEGSILSITQVQFLRNQLAALAEEKIELEFDTNKPNEFIQQEAYKRGQIAILRYLLDTSETSIEVRDNINQ